MGIGNLFGISSSCADLPMGETKLPNPDPKNYKILKHQKMGTFLVLQINYPDCKNYEGNKTLLYQGVELEQLKKQGSIDPHFAENKDYISPIARFEPTKKGWMLATLLAGTIAFDFDL